MSLTISILITNFNTWTLTQRCIQAANHWSSSRLDRILVVDDASKEPTPNDLPENVRVIKAPQNKGYVSSVNLGFANLKEDIVLLLDSDAYLKNELTLTVIQKFIENPTLGALGFQLVGQQGQPAGSFENEPTVLGLLLGQKLESKFYNFLHSSKVESPCIFSCAIAIRRTAFESVDGFDEEFDFLDADIDFSIRLRKAGWNIQVDPSLIVFHEGGGSYQTTAKRVLRHHKNRWHLLEKHGFIQGSLLLKTGLAIRHLIEYSILRVFGKQLIVEPLMLSDKLFSRQQLLRSVWSGYGNETK